MGLAEDTTALNAALDELLPLCRGAVPPAQFLLGPVPPENGVREYYRHYLDLLGIPADALPRERFYLNADLPFPAYLENRGGAFSLYLDTRLFVSTDVVALAIAHEFTHLYLQLRGHQQLQVSRSTASAISRLTEDEEARTDVASVALGLGRIVLNGLCAHERALDGGGLTGSIGSLSPKTYAALYRRANERLGISSVAATEGLTDDARALVR